MFEPNPPLKRMPKIVKRKMPPYTGISAYLESFERGGPPPLPPKGPTPKEMKLARVAARMKVTDELTDTLRQDWNPLKNSKATE
jgi:hypothetical protein